jgi:hypothetical protein
MHLENSQVGRSLDHYFQARSFTVPVFLEGTMLTPKDGFDGFYIKRGPCVVNNTLKHLLHGAPTRKEEIPAILSLVNRIRIAELFCCSARSRAKHKHVE